jgi:hypothetical protein
VAELTAAERQVLEHAVGFTSRVPFYRNYYVAEEGHHAWRTLLELEKRGLMERYVTVDHKVTFRVTDLGIAALGPVPRVRSRGRK